MMGVCIIKTLECLKISNRYLIKIQIFLLGDCCVEKWYGDGYCETVNRHEKCGNFDGGDCDPKYPDCYKATLIGNGECDEGNPN